MKHLGPIGGGDDACMDALAASPPFAAETPAMHPKVRNTASSSWRRQVAVPELYVDVAPVRLRPAAALSVASGGAPRDPPGDRAAVAAAPQPLQFAAPQRLQRPVQARFRLLPMAAT
ncbi:hypothetical protein CCMA1212_010242 [Trichoderma ghanense]|uniref:Uncharacterized protein n=1 Tax=Trichoderma ghanense TaxID=65468 RepID=A0ABY2GQM0_9HYPO